MCEREKEGVGMGREGTPIVLVRKGGEGGGKGGGWVGGGDG